MSSEQNKLLDKEIIQLIDNYRTVPTPWVIFSDTHPYSISFRMGNGEWFMMTFDHWWKEQNFSVTQRINYFRNYPPPPRWMVQIICRIWDIKWILNDGSEADLTEYFAQLEQYGFGTQVDYLEDVRNPKWHR